MTELIGQDNLAQQIAIRARWASGEYGIVVSSDFFSCSIPSLLKHVSTPF